MCVCFSFALQFISLPLCTNRTIQWQMTPWRCIAGVSTFGRCQLRHKSNILSSCLGVKNDPSLRKTCGLLQHSVDVDGEKAFTRQSETHWVSGHEHLINKGTVRQVFLLGEMLSVPGIWEREEVEYNSGDNLKLSALLRGLSTSGGKIRTLAVKTTEVRWTCDYSYKDLSDRVKCSSLQ